MHDWKREIQQKIKTEGVCLTKEGSKDFSELMQTCENEIKKVTLMNPPTSVCSGSNN